MFAERLATAREAVLVHLKQVLEGYPDQPVVEAMAYGVSGGKGLRGFLVIESAALYQIPKERAIWPATAIEAMHGYSLVHDDLPCMDDDDLRRGLPTVHIKWDQATAVLAGDALQALAFELALNDAAGGAATRADLALSLAQAAGARGMVLGQALDIAAESATTPLTLDQITALQVGKTGALIEWAATAGARLAEADQTPLRQYARALGLAFQIADDILDIEGDAALAGKRLQKDEAAGKATFVSLLGLDGARNRARSLVESACDALAPFGDKGNTLREAAHFVISRES